MSKQTITKFIRTHQKATLPNGLVRFFKRNEPLPALPLKEQVCLANCGKPMYVAEGQIAYAHKECRSIMKRRKRIYGI